MNEPHIEHSLDSAYKAPQISVYHGKPKHAPRKRRWLLWTTIIILGLLLGVTTAAFIAARKWSKLSFVGNQGGFFGGAKDLIQGSTGQVPIEGEKSGVVRILLLGIGGEGHDGPYLSDTIIVAQIKLDTNEVSLTSIPRDYQVKLQSGEYRKINAAFAEGYYQHKDWDEAGRWARDAVSKLSGLDLPYFAVVDFSGFEQAVDQVGGVDVVVDRTFTDYQYPNSTNGYLPPQTFTAGPQHFNGSQALVFARSRHAAGPEGSDFSRSQRQQKIIQAFREKVQKLNLVTDSGQLATLLQTFASHFHTNFTPGQILRLARIGQKMDASSVVATSLDPITGLVCPQITEETKAYILAPCAGKSTDDIQSYFKNALAIGKLAKEKSVVWIATANPKSSVYKRVESDLQQAGLTVWPIAYNDVEPDQSVIYEINAKPATSEYIKATLGAREVTVPPPNIKIDATRSDIILILGNNIPERFTKPIPATTQKVTPPITPPSPEAIQ